MKEKFEILVKALVNADREQLKQRIDALENDQKVLLKSFLTKLNKSQAFPEVNDVEYVKGNINDTILQEDKADDDVDETLVKESAATISHQGDGTEHLIKGRWRMITRDGIRYYAEGPYEGLKVGDVKEQGAQLTQEQSAQYDIDLPGRARKEEKDEPNKKPKKDDKPVAERVATTRKDSEKDKESKVSRKVQSKEQEKAEIKEQAERNKDKKPGKDEEKVKKSIVWAGEDQLLKACTRGRNYHYNVNGYIDDVVANKEKLETLQKSLSTAPNASPYEELLLKGITCTQYEAEELQRLQKSEPRVDPYYDQMLSLLGFTADPLA